MRAEAAKMIYVIRNGGVDDLAAGWTGMTTFSDVPAGAWYEGYVNYCASLGIIAGVGNGKFNPNGAVTGVELAKMLLVVADYKPEIEGYTGAGWNLNVIRDAQTAGMFKGYTLAYSAAATRQQAAQLFSNAILETQMAVYIGDTRVNDLAMITNTGTIGGRYFGLFTVTGILTKTQHVDLPLNTNAWTANGTSALNANDELSEVFVTDRNADGNMIGPTPFEFAADPDLLYQEVDVIFREDTDDPGVLSRDAKVYAVLSTGNTYVYDTTMDAITIEVKDDSMAPDTNPDTNGTYNPLTIQFEGYNGGRAKTLPNGFTLPVIFNLYEGATFNAGVAANGAARATWDRDIWVLNDHHIEMVATTSTAPIRLIDFDRDGELDIAFVTTPYYGTVASYNADRYEFTTNATIDGDNITTGRRQVEFENFTFEDDLEKDDVIAINIDVTSGEVLYTVSLVEPTVGVVTYVYSTDPDNEVVIGGETYGFYGLRFDGKYLDDATVNLSADDYNAAYEDEVTVYTDGKYIISAEVDPADLGNKFAFVKNYNLQGNSFDLMPTDSRAILIELVLPNGTTVVKEYDREEVSSSTVDFYEDNEIAAQLPNMLGNIVEYSTSGNYVAIRKVYNTPENDPDLAPNYYDNIARVFTFNSKTGVFTAAGNVSIDVNDESVLFLPTYKDGVTKDTLVQGDITDVDVILGANLRGEPTVTTEVGNLHSMQMVSCLQDGVNTVAFAALNANSTISDAGVFAYALTNDWDKDDGEEDAQQVRAVLSNSGSDEGAVVDLNNSGILANKIYRAVLDSDGDYTFEEIVNGETVGNATIMFGSIRGRNGNNVSIDGNVFHVTEETVIFVVDIDARGSMTRINLGDVSDLTTANLVNGAYRTNVLFETDPQNELTVVYVEAVGDDLTPVINYRVQNSLSVTMPSLTMGMTQPEVEAAITNAFPANFNLTFNWNGATFPVTAAQTYSPTIKLTPKTGSTVENDANGQFVVTMKIGNNSVAIQSTVATDGTVTINMGANKMATTLNEITTANVKAMTVAPMVVGGGTNVNATNVTVIIEDAEGNNLLKGAAATQWKSYNGSNVGATPVAGNKYELVLTLEAANDYAFSAAFDEAYFGEKLGSDDVIVKDVNGNRTKLEVSAVITAGDVVLNSLTFTGITVPQTGDTLSGITAPTMPGTSVTNVKWFNADGGDISGGNAPANATLTVTFDVTAVTYYALGTGMTKDNVTLPADYAVTNVSYSRDNLTLTVTATVNVATAEATLGTITAFNANTIVADGTHVSDAQASLTGETGVAIKTEWKDDNGDVMDANDTFVRGQKYSITVTISLKEGYKWAAGVQSDPGSELGDYNQFTGFDSDKSIRFDSEKNTIVITASKQL